jgi:hypothetical protein
MISIQLARVALVGTCVFLPLAAGQHRSFPAAFPPQFYHGHGFPATNHHHRNLRRQQQRRVQNDSSPPPFFDCGENPIVKQDSGCPCFSAETISSLMDVETDADSCYYYATAPVNASDQCSYLYPRSASFSASTTYTDTSSYSVNFAVTSNFYPPMPMPFESVSQTTSETSFAGPTDEIPVDPVQSMQGAGSCSAGVYYSKYVYDQTGSSSNSESHGYDMYMSVTKEQMEDCLDVLNEVKATLPKPLCVIDVAGGVV